MCFYSVLLSIFTRYVYKVLMVDYRGFGKSTGKRSQKAIKRDLQLVHNKVKDQTTEDRIILYGRSLGTGIAFYLASKNNPKQLVLETPYYSILDVAKSRFPVFPVKRLLIIQFPTFKYLPKINNSVTILHGTDDSLVPYSSGKKLDELALKNVNFVTIKDGGHNNLIEFKEYHKAIKSIL